MDGHETSADEIIRRQAEARHRERAVAAKVGTPGYQPSPPSAGFSFSEATGRGTTARLVSLLVLALGSFLLIGQASRGSVGFLTLVLGASGVCFYFLPSIEASLRKQPNMVSIALVNVFLGWTLVGWVVAMAWGCAARQERQLGAAPKDVMPPKPDVSPTRPASAPSASVADELRKLADLKQQGILSDEEFAAQKARVLSS
ncbi:superinfection immunity protein [Achromobacter xylosoxidans]